VTHDGFRRMSVVARLQKRPGGGEAFTDFPIGIGQLLPTLLVVFELAISHAPTLRPERSKSCAPPSPPFLQDRCKRFTDYRPRVCGLELAPGR